MRHVLLDTDTLSEIIKLRDVTVRQRALAYTRMCGPLTFSAITRYEVMRGYKYKQASAQLNKFATFCHNSHILPVTEMIWERASDLWAYARSHGHPHKDADLIIAATALEEGISLATGNTGDFAWVPGLAIEDWRQP